MYHMTVTERCVASANAWPTMFVLFAATFTLPVTHYWKIIPPLLANIILTSRPAPIPVAHPLFSRAQAPPRSSARRGGWILALVLACTTIMDSTYRPASPALGNLPESPDLSGLRPQSPDLSAAQLSPPAYTNFAQHQFNQSQHSAYSASAPQYAYQPTSVPQLPSDPRHHNFYPSPHLPSMAPRRLKNESDDDDFMPDAPATSRRTRGIRQEVSTNGLPSFEPAPMIKREENSDPTLGCTLKTSFPVARIKRIMQADEDIGKVAQVTPTVVSRALELFMIKLISAAAHQARGPADAAGSSKGPRRVLAQHLKKAVLADKKLDFLEDHVSKVPDAPSKSSKKDAGSDSEDAKPVKKKGKKRQESGDDI
ncbi:hypothetical protein AC579_9355 [Pseudocercospora musae]|uniref:Transcription factor CBF/NF-Y/archaeal histone domain-containing protein n=1 Tax=Pseudocercospora musae TaxID=113226 RepID=A0A139I2L7_9PEZI|nr:hypothetical protein AC579_9355 [Pseudocercospora musae]